MKDTNRAASSLTSSEFRELLERYLELMRSGGVIVDDEYVVMVKLWNTISWEHLEEADELCASYNSTFFPDFLRRASVALGALPTKGMALLAKERGLHLGGTPDDASRYHIID